MLNVDPEEHRSTQSPDEFAIEHKLVVNNRLRRDLAEALFTAQLGTPFADADNAFEQFNDHERAMFTIFGLQHFLDKRSEAEQLLDVLNRSSQTAGIAIKLATPTSLWQIQLSGKSSHHRPRRPGSNSIAMPGQPLPRCMITTFIFPSGATAG
ncbi:hypothetical protein ACMV5I_28785 [Serratia sp. T13T92]|uniref:secretion/conjugation apparatus DotM-related subunit n=1 Tax=Serratia sp. T13T92 TaxID=3397496 RepID=UPI0039DFDE10